MKVIRTYDAATDDYGAVTVRRTKKGKLLRHGTNAAYATHGCRCPLCKAANRVYMREYLKRRAEREAGSPR